MKNYIRNCKHFLLKGTKASGRIIWVKISETEIAMEIQAGKLCNHPRDKKSTILVQMCSHPSFVIGIYPTFHGSHLLSYWW